MECKKCTRCLEIKPLDGFALKKKGKPGLCSYCRKCQSDLANQWRKDNPEKALEYKREWTAKNREAINERYRESAAISARRRRVVNPEKSRQASQKYYEKNKADITLRKNKDVLAQKRFTRRARIKQAPGMITAKEWGDLKKFYNYTCLCCLKREPEIKLSLDHVVPLARGGANTIGNAQPLCHNCNSRKWTNVIDYRL